MPAHKPAQPQPHLAAESPLNRYRRILETGNNTERLVFFSDAVMAIALTLLVLEIRVPTDATKANLVGKLLDDVGSLYAFLLAFILITFNWLAHHRKFKVIERYDQRLVMINFGYLLFIALLPLPVRVMAQYGAVPVAVVLYALIIALPLLFQFALWEYAWRAKLFTAEVDRGLYRYVRFNLLPMPVIFLLSIPVTLIWGAGMGICVWFAVIPANIATGIIQRSRENRALGRS